MDFLVTRVQLPDLALAFLSLFLVTALFQRLTNKGPMLWPVLGIIPTLLFHANDIFNWGTEALIKCGGTFYFRGVWTDGVHGIMTVDPSTVEYMLKTRFKNFPKGKHYKTRFYELLGDGIFNADDEVWKEQRQAAVSEMHSHQFMKYSHQTIQELVQMKLLKLLDKLVSSGQTIDLQDLLLRFTFDNICTAAFGIDPGCLTIDLPDVPFAKAFERAAELTMYRFLLPPAIWKPMKFFDIGLERQLKEAVQTVNEFAMETVTERRIEFRKLRGLNDRFDLLSRLVMVKDPHGQGEKYRYNEKFLKDFCISFILAGRDTSSVALTWFFWLIHDHPQVENRILDEIKDIIGNQKFSGQNTDMFMFSIDDLEKMVYLQAALSESLRLYPPVPIDWKEVREEDVFPNGTVIKRGAKVVYSIYAMARIEAIWGKNCREFKPERWIKDGQFVSESQFKYVVFNGGPRLCVGKKFAYMQMKMVAASILLRYSVEIVEGQTVFPNMMTTTLYMKNGLRVSFKPRMKL